MLKQNNGELPRIIKLLNDVRGAYDDSLVNLRRDERVWKRTVKQKRRITAATPYSSPA